MLDEADEEVTDHVVHHEQYVISILLCVYQICCSKTVKTPKVLHTEKEVTDQEVADVDAAEEDDVMVTESLIENLGIQRAHTRYLHSFKAFKMSIFPQFIFAGEYHDDFNFYNESLMMMMMLLLMKILQ